MSDSLSSHELQHSRPPCPSPIPGVYQTHVHWVGDAIQPSHPLSSPSPPAFNLSQHQCLFKWVSSSHQVAKVLELQLHHQSIQWIFNLDFLLGLIGLISLQSEGLSRILWVRWYIQPWKGVWTHHSNFCVEISPVKCWSLSVHYLKRDYCLYFYVFHDLYIYYYATQSQKSDVLYFYLYFFSNSLGLCNTFCFPTKNSYRLAKCHGSSLHWKQ